MRKFWNLMLVALVTLGAAACTDTEENVDKAPEQSAGLSFYAEIVDGTRAYIDDTDGDKTWNTIWEEGDSLYVGTTGNDPFVFTYDGEKFTCTTNGVRSLLGQDVTISAMNPNRDSKAGKKGWSITSTTVENFEENATVNLTSDTSFLRYTYNGDSDITFTVKAAAPNNTYVFQYEDDLYEDVTISGVKGENFIAFWTQSLQAISATLSYSIDGVKCKETELSLVPGKIYNLGTLTEAKPEVETTTVYFSPGVWDVDGAWFSAHVWNASESSDVKLTDEDADGIYECEVPADMTNIIFCRMNPAYTEFGWNNESVNDRVWNQTADLEIGIAPNNYYYIHDWEVGMWGTKDGYDKPEPKAPWAIAGSFNDWSNLPMEFTDTENLYVARDLTLAEDTEFKIKDVNTWDVSFGYSEPIEADHFVILDNTAGLDNNIRVATMGTYDLYFEYVDGGNCKLYVMTAGGDYTTAVEQTAGGNEGGNTGVASNVGLVGTFQDWNVAAPVAMMETSEGWVVATGVELYKSDEFKFVEGNSWDNPSYGNPTSVLVAEVDTEYTLTSDGGQNIKASKNGKFDIYFNTVSKVFKYTCTEEYTSLTVDIIFDNKANWSPLYVTLKSGETIVADNATVIDNKYTVSGEYIGQTLTYVVSNGTKTLEGNVTIAKSGATISVDEVIIKLTFVADTDNTKQWFNNAHIHVWGTGTAIDSPGWPGIAMTDNGDKTWSINVPSELVGKTINYVVNNGGDWKSKDSKVTIKAEGNTINLSSIGIN